MVMIDIGEPKSAREMLCLAQHALIRTGGSEYHIARIEKMIDQIDVLRPLGPDGKHGNRHTDNCGCDGAIVWRQIAAYPWFSVDSTGRLRDVNGYLVGLNSWEGVMPEPYYTLVSTGRIRKNYTPAQLVKNCFPELDGPTEYPIMKAVD